MAQELIHPIGSTYVYSDINMITAMYVVGHLAQQYESVATADLNPQCIANLKPTDPECVPPCCRVRILCRSCSLQDRAVLL